MQPETKFKLQVFKDLRTLKKTWFFKSQEVSVKGIPDIIMCSQGKFIALELKRNTRECKSACKKLSLQKRNLGLINEALGFGIFTCPKCWDMTFEKIKSWL